MSAGARARRAKTNFFESKATFHPEINMNREIVILSGVRTAIGGYGGSLKDSPPSEMAATCVREAVTRSGIDVKDVGHIVFGNIIHTDAHDHYLARVAGVNGGLPHETPALTLNRLCGSGLQAIITCAQTIMLGDAEVTVAGGAENMSRSPYSSPAMRFGARMNDTKMVDMMVAALSDPFDDCHMGVTAENVAKRYKISRQDQDALAVESHRRAGSAIDQGYFKAQIVPIEIKVKRDKVPFVTDETVRHGTTVEKLAKLPTVFDPEGSVTAGNASEHQRCGGGPCAGGWRVCQQAGSEADWAPYWLCLCRCRSQVYGYRTGAGGAEAAQKNRLRY